MAFNRTEADQLLVDCHRRCCVCHRFCGIKMELHHIDPSSNGGGDSIENAIPVCFECHAEIQLYNDSHPRGRKFHPGELHKHKKQWLSICRESPGSLLLPQRPLDAGPIQVLVDELDFNLEIVQVSDNPQKLGAPFLVDQFKRSIQEGAFSLLPDSMRKPIATAYCTLMRINAYLHKMVMLPDSRPGSDYKNFQSAALASIASAKSEVAAALEGLLTHLGHSAGGN